MKEIEEREKGNIKYPMVTISSQGRLALKFPPKYTEDEKNHARQWIRTISDKIGLPEFSVRGTLSTIGNTYLHQGSKGPIIKKYKIGLDMNIEDIF